MCVRSGRLCGAIATLCLKRWKYIIMFRGTKMEEKKKKFRDVGKTLDAWSRFLILDECLRDRVNYYLLDELVDKVNDKLEEYGYDPVSKRTIQEDLKFMKSERGWGIELKSGITYGDYKLYHYADPDYSIMNMPMTQAESDLLAEAMAMLGRFRVMPNNTWLESALRMMQVKFNVDCDTTIAKPAQNDRLKGLDWFEPLFEACRKRLIVTMKYNRFDRLDKEPEQRVVKPYQMRQYNNRWYLVGQEDAKLPRLPMVVIPIDRIVDLTIETLEEKKAREKEGGRYKVPTDMQIEAWYKDIIGVSRLPEGEPQPVRVKAWGLAAHYLETKPLHWSQEVQEGEGFKEFKWNVIPNEELVQALIVYADQIEILEGEWVRKKLLERAEKIQLNNQNQ